MGVVITRQSLRDKYTLPSPPQGWPLPLGEAAMNGLIGDIVHTIAPHTEADPAALVGSFIVKFGNEVGRGPHFFVERDCHHLNLFALDVGASSKARKGIVEGHTDYLFEQAIPGWRDRRVKGGLSSGEGLALAASKAGSDRRLLFVENEFSSVLRAAARRGSLLTTTMRDGWDGKPIEFTTKHDPIRVTDAHLSVLGAITFHDLRRYMDQTDIFNGFANRFLFFCAKRTRILPFGGTVPEDAARQLVSSLREALEFARSVGEIGISSKARALWEREYPRLSADTPGRVGAATSRAEAQTRRLAAIYAVLDKKDEVKIQHLRAALGVWKYCQDSAIFIFGRSGHGSLEQTILRVLPTSGLGITRTEISHAFSGHRTADEISAALEHLRDQGRAASKRVRTGGRTAERWIATARNG